MLTATSIPALWRLARVEYDDVRKRPVLLYPEGAVLLNDTGAAILKLVDGQRSVGDIARVLSDQYNGAGSADPAEILNDVTAYLSKLAAQELIRDQ
jgi:coenzyme PQQ biosynthesis protein PqqD